MKVLFVCRQNIGRSQMAAALYNLLHQEGGADSAGTVVDVPGQRLQDAPAPKTIAAMQELGVDVSKNTRSQITPALLDEYDKIIVMSEPENTPDWLRDNPKSVVWDVEDTKTMDLDGTRRTRDELQKLVAEL